MLCGKGADRGEPSQQLRERLVPSCLMECCQWGRKTIAPGGFLTGLPYILRSWKWSSCLCSPAPMFPCTWGTKLTSSKAANGLLSRSDCLRLNGLYNHFYFFCGEGGLGGIKVWVANRRDAANISKRKLVVMIDIRNSTGFHDVVFSHSAPCLSRRELVFDS